MFFTVSTPFSLEPIKYNLWLQGSYTSSFKELKDGFCLKGRLPCPPERWKEVFLLNRNEPVALLEVIGKLLGVGARESFEANNIK
jgi:hypothetical protein